MKRYLTFLLALIPLATWAQHDSAGKHAPYERHSTIITLSFGFIDHYRNNYTLPPAFEKGNTTGFPPVYARIEYGLGKHISLAGTLGYDAFVNNFNQLYTGYNGTIRRYKTDYTTIVSEGVALYYHLQDVLPVKRLDPFIGVGIAIQNVRHSAYAQGDSTIVKTDHSAAPYLKAGARYAISDNASMFGDVGYDKQSIFSLGFSYRYFSKK
jgi:opacity protein-like surface antigen